MQTRNNSLNIQANRDYLELTLILSRLDKAERILNLIHDGHELSDRENRLSEVVTADWQNCQKKLSDLLVTLNQ